jgi:inosose dehydratase
VESAEELDRFLDRVDVGLTLDTGHLVIGGGDPLEVLQRWGPRVNHLHVKDVDLGVLERVLAAGGGMADVWSSGAFVAFGTGDIDVTAVMNAVDALDFTGWVVVEQDVLPARDVSMAEFRSARVADQRLNREVLRQWC